MLHDASEEMAHIRTKLLSHSVLSPSISGLCEFSGSLIGGDETCNEQMVCAE